MAQVFIEANNIISSLGFTTQENAQNVFNGITGIKTCSSKDISPHPFPASFIEDDLINDKFAKIGDNNAYTRFEKLAILSLKDALDQSSITADDNRTLFVLSTTKGNVELLDDNLKGDFSDDRLNLHSTAKVIASFFGFKNSPKVVSNACISGLAAMILGQRLINAGLYDNVVVTGADVISKFVVSGFQSFLSLSENPCKPFDANRNGLSIGEGAATAVVTKNKTNIEIVSGAISNDANHISGPSQTGEGLLVAIGNTMKNQQKPDVISAHGTATPYNDDMESMAISRSELDAIPANSLKGFFGHTLGAAGLIETLINLESLKHNELIKTMGCIEPGTVKKINIIQQNSKQELKSLLKLASGFGGCNAAGLFVKHG